DGYAFHDSVGGVADASGASTPGPTSVIAPVTLNALGAATVCPAATVTWTIAVPEMHGSGSRTRPSFSNAASTTYLPGGTPAIENAPLTFGAVPASGARSPGTTTPRPLAASKVDSTITTIEVAPEPATMSAVPVSVPGASAVRCRSA